MKDRTPFDEAYKSLFSHPEMVKDLLLGFVHEDWVKDLDFSTLTPYPSESITKQLKKRRGDVIWKIRFKSEWLYLYLCIEFQSDMLHFMAVRIMVYIGLLYQKLIIQDPDVKASKKLPPVMPLVLYNGTRPWTAPLSMRELIDVRVPEALKVYQPQLSYWLLDEMRYNKDNLLIYADNPVMQLVALEQVEDSLEIGPISRKLGELLNRPEQAELRQAFISYMTYVMDAEGTILPQAPKNFQEVETMAISFNERMKIANQEAELRGEERGKHQGELELVSRLLARKFGPLSDIHAKQLESMDSDELLDLGDRLLEAHSIDELFSVRKH